MREIKDTFLLSNNFKYSEGECDFISIRDNCITFSEYFNKPIFFGFKDGNYYISESIQKIHNIIQTPIDPNGIIQLFIFGNNLYPFSIYKKIFPVIPGSEIILDENGITLNLSRSESLNSSDLTSDIFDDFENKINEYYKDLEKNPYVLFSGGLDSSIILYYLQNTNPDIGCSIYTEQDEKDIKPSLKNYNYKNINFNHLNSSEYLNQMENYDHYYPFINPGCIDDLIHCKNACKNKNSYVTSGIGADELLGDFNICYDKEIITTERFFSKYTFLHKDLLSNLFNREQISVIIGKTLEKFSLNKFSEKLDFNIYAFHIYNQNSLLKNNSILGKIKRKDFFNSNIFYDFSRKLPEDYLFNNQIEKFFLKVFIKNKISKDLSFKQSRDFDINSEKLANNDFFDYLKNNIDLLHNFSNYNDFNLFKNISKSDLVKICHLLNFLKKLS